MFTTRRRKRWKRKTQRRPWVLITLLSLVGIPIGAELLARGVATMTGAGQQFEAEQSARDKITQAYRLKFLSPTGEAYPELSSSGALSAARNPLLSYQLLPGQKSQFWTINPQGFRDTDPVTLEKPPGEVRIFVLGSSMAFGQLSSSEEATFPQQLEKLLNDQVSGQRANSNRYQPQILPYLAEDVEKALALPARIPDRQYRVINAAVPGYASGNTLALFTQQVVNYRPDLVIMLDGYADLMLPSVQSGVDIPGLEALLQGKREDNPENQFSNAVKGWFNQLYLVQGFQLYVLRSPQSNPETVNPLNLMVTDPEQRLDQSLAADSAELERRVDRYQNHLLQLVRWSAAAKKPLFVGIQPEITGRAQKTPEEAAIVEQLGSSYAERIKAGYSQLTESASQAVKTSNSATLLDLQTLYAKTPEQAFYDPTTLTDAANQELAQQFFRAIAARLAVQPQPFGS